MEKADAAEEIVSNSSAILAQAIIWRAAVSRKKSEILNHSSFFGLRKTRFFNGFFKDFD